MEAVHAQLSGPVCWVMHHLAERVKLFGLICCQKRAEETADVLGQNDVATGGGCPALLAAGKLHK